LSASEAASESATGVVALDLPLTGSHLIEASAGTGKTWTLSALFVRLVVEGELTVDRVLAVTFTRAATAELRQRIRQRLTDLLSAYAGGPADAVSEFLLRADPIRASRRARAALAAFDSAPIYTIHGFAQRALTERAFSAGVPFDIELGETRATWEEAVRDFWRNHVARWRIDDGLSEKTHEYFVAKLIAQRETPTRWLEWLLQVRAASGARIETNGWIRKVTAEELFEQHQDLVQLWKASRDDVEQILLNHPSLKRQSYSKGNVPRWWVDVDTYFAGGALEPAEYAEKAVYYMTTTAMSRRLKERPAAAS
jgi:exodeoxyribonuclease V beta subunit